MDPDYITSSDWNNIGNLLHYFWFLLLFAISFGFSFLMAHAIIPSLIGTGHIPESLNSMRRVLYIGALGFLVLIVFTVSRIVSEVSILGEFWGRFWI